ncbi:hypothetical protein [Hydrogenophaga sp. T2]|uniref:hypothetical protein n=1 Tax=Hydrogenophaga sp. T2 TaxID=3132823 RepID=UPI003CE8267B
MSSPKAYLPSPAAGALIDVLAKIRARCKLCPACVTPWLWSGNHQDAIWHAQIQLEGTRYNVRKTVHAAHATKPLGPGEVVTTRCECPNCLNPELLVTETKGDVVRRQTAQGLHHHAQHRAAIDRARREKRETKLDMQKAREIRASEAPLRELAQRYGVSAEAVRRVRANLNWRETTPFSGLGAR